jgi:hypothetical protein
MNMEGGVFPYFKEVSCISPGGTEENYKNPVRITGNPDETRTGYLQDRSRKCYWYTDLLGKMLGVLPPRSCVHLWRGA